MLLLLKQGNEAVAAGQRAKQLVTSETPEADVAFIEAVLAEDRADFPAAERQYRRLAALAPDDGGRNTELADFLKRQYRNQEAVNAYHDVLRLDPQFVRPHVELCQLYTRLTDYPLAEQHARNALDNYRAGRNRTGEGQALLCLGDLQRLEGRFVDARRDIDAARDIFESLGLQYSLSRVFHYLAVISGDSGDTPAAVQFFEESLSRSRQVGNREMEGRELTNLGVAHERLGQRVRALKYYNEGRDIHQQNGDERQAAEQDINVASLLVEAGSDQVEALRRAANARAMLHNSGSVDFEVIAMQVEAASHLYAGRHNEATRELLEALTLANERKLTKRSVWLTVKLAESHFAVADYEAARMPLEDAAGSDAGRDDPEVAITLGRVLVRMGDVDNAKGHLERALATVEATGYLLFAPLAHMALGELEYESGNALKARAHFEKAAAFWTDDLPDAASVEAKCYLGLIDALTGKASTVHGTMERSVEQARKMGRLSVEAQCRLHLAHILFRERRHADAIATLSEIPSGGETSVGSELQAQTHYWRSRVMNAQGDRAGAEVEAAQALKLVKELRDALPATYRERFASRQDIRQVIENNPVRERR